MKKSWGIIAAIGFSACSGPTPAPGGAASVGRAELRQAAPIAAARITGDLTTAAIQFVQSQRATLGLGANDSFAVLKIEPDAAGLDHVRMQQLHQGIKVWGADIVVHGQDAELSAIDGNLAASLRGLDLTPALSFSDALSAAKFDYARGAAPGSALAFSREAQELVILPLDNGDAHLAWHVSFFTEHQAGIKPGLWHYFIDAHDGSIVQQFNGLHTVTATGPGGNTRVKRTWNNNLEVTASGANYVMDTPQYRTTNMAHATTGTGTTYSGTSLTAYNTADPAANDAHGFAQVTVKMLKDWFGYNSIDNAGLKIISRVHYSNNYANAFWDGTEMTYGDGDGTQLFQMSGSLDVVAHEIDHGFTEKHANLTYSGQSGGMNESFSDIAGTSAKFFFDATTASFDLGGDIFVQANQYIRYMCKPSMDGQSIDNAAQYKAGLDVHFSSGVMNRAFCRAAKRLSGVNPDTGAATAAGVKAAAKAFYVANANYWTAGATYVQGCQGTVDAATKTLMYAAGDVSAIGDSWKDVGVTCTYTHVNDFALTLDPPMATATAGTSTTYKVNTTVAVGSTAEPLMLTVTGLPAGVTGTFTPATVTSGASAMLKLDLATTAAAGDVTFTVKAAGTGSRTVDGKLTVVAAPPPPPDMAGPTGGEGGGSGGGNGTGGGTGGGTGTGGNGAGNGNGAGGSMSGCSVAVGSAAGSSGLGLILLGIGFAFVSRRRRS
ncbi:MAG: bacillolysin [Myxococcales bacterium]|nr:bacillolysin [Myxococcales bacterium]